MSDNPSAQRSTSEAAAAPVDPTSLPPAKRPHDLDASDALLRLYVQKRIQGQLDFYRRRVQEFDANTGFMVSIGAAIMAISAFVSAVGTTLQSPVLALITAILPAVAALVAGFRQLYQWEKQSALYRDASLGLQEALLIMPDEDVYDKRSAKVVYETLVRSAEDVFMAEINQWGQIALGLTSREDQDRLNQALRDIESQAQAAGQGGEAAQGSSRKSDKDENAVG